MRKITATLGLTLAVLLGSEVRGSDLPVCKGSPLIMNENDTQGPCIGKSWWGTHQQNFCRMKLWDSCEGDFTFSDGDKYVGEYRNGKRHGQGTYTYASTDKWVKTANRYRKKRGQGNFSYMGGKKYVGGWKNDYYHGHGAEIYLDGTKFVGEFRNGKRNGQGTFTYPDGRVEQSVWKDDKFQYAQTFTPTQNFKKSPPPPRSAAEIKKERVWRESEAEGSNLSPCPLDQTKRYHICYGSRNYAAGQKYVGEWKNNLFHGQGSLFSYGKVFEGIWRKNELHKGAMTVANGKVIEASGEIIFSPQNSEVRFSPKISTVRQSSLPSKSAAEKEIERLRRENARLKKQKQSRPKQVAERPEPKPDLALAKRTQEALQVLQIYSGKIDGIIGVKTRVAIRGWQTRNGYPATGAIDQTQIAKLEESAIRYLKEKKSKPEQVAKKPPPKKAPQPKVGSTGSGFFVSKLGHIITNEHVVRQCGSVTVGDNANKQVTASVLETDKRNDLALLRVSTQMASAETKSLISKLGLKLVPLASEGLFKSEDVELGEDVLVAGFPHGDFYSDGIKVTKGIVSGKKGMGDDRGQFQMDAAVQKGNSGGPIYDENGNIVGVVVSQLDPLKVAKAIGSLPQNVNFGIKASTVRQFLTSAGIPTKWSNRTKRKSFREVAQIADKQTVMVVCNP